MIDEEKRRRPGRGQPAFVRRYTEATLISPGNGEDVREATPEEIAEAVDLWRRELALHIRNEPSATVEAALLECAGHLLTLGAEVDEARFFPSRNDRDEEHDFAAAVGALAIASEMADHIAYAVITRDVFRRLGRMSAWFHDLQEVGGLLGFAGDLASIALDGFDVDEETRLHCLAATTLENLGPAVLCARHAQIDQRHPRVPLEAAPSSMATAATASAPDSPTNVTDEHAATPRTEPPMDDSAAKILQLLVRDIGGPNRMTATPKVLEQTARIAPAYLAIMGRLAEIDRRAAWEFVLDTVEEEDEDLAHDAALARDTLALLDAPSNETARLMGLMELGDPLFFIGDWLRKQDAETLETTRNAIVRCFGGGLRSERPSASKGASPSAAGPADRVAACAP